MHIILDTHSSNSEYNCGCDYAIVELTPALGEEIRQRIELARQAGQRDNDLYELYFWGGTAAFYDLDLIEACEEALAASAEAADTDRVVCDWISQLEKQGRALLPAGVDLEKLQPQRTECDQVIIRCSPSLHNPGFEVAWTTIPKHSDIYVNTSDLPLTDLESYFRNDKPTETVQTGASVTPAASSATTTSVVEPAEHPRHIRLPCYGITIRLDRQNTGESPGHGTITSDLKSHGRNARDRLYHAAIDGLESLILAHACAGIDVAAPGYVEGIETAVDAIANHFA